MSNDRQLQLLENEFTGSQRIWSNKIMDTIPNPLEFKYIILNRDDNIILGYGDKVIHKINSTDGTILKSKEILFDDCPFSECNTLLFGRGYDNAVLYYTEPFYWFLNINDFEYYNYSYPLSGFVGINNSDFIIIGNPKTNQSDLFNVKTHFRIPSFFSNYRSNITFDPSKNAIIDVSYNLIPQQIIVKKHTLMELKQLKEILEFNFHKIEYTDYNMIVNDPMTQ